jgi:hypothetical protein
MKRVLLTSAALVMTTAAYAADTPTVAVTNPVMDAIVTIGVSALTAIAGFAFKYAKAHWAILNDARVNEALAAFAQRIAASILTKMVQEVSNTSPMAIPPRAVTVTHPEVIAGADKLLAKYPGFSDHIGMDTDAARAMIVQEYDKLKAPANARVLNPAQPLLTGGP